MNEPNFGKNNLQKSGGHKIPKTISDRQGFSKVVSIPTHINDGCMPRYLRR